MENREQTISRVTIWGAIANMALSAIKLCAGILGHSAAMVADAVHSISDLASDIVILVMVRISSRKQDKNHDYGHGKYETLATAAVALLLLVVGGKLMAGAIGRIHAILGGDAGLEPGWIAFAAALVSIAVKEVLYHWTARVGKRVNSPAMITNAWHHRTDALSSVASAVGIGAALMLGGRWAILDPLVCCAISIFIIYIAVKMAIPALNELTEGSLPEDMENDITQVIQSVAGVDNVHALKTRRNGPNIMIEAHVVVNPAMSVREAHIITDQAENALRKRYGAETHISLHIEPSVEAE